MSDFLAKTDLIDQPLPPAEPEPQRSNAIFIVLGVVVALAALAALYVFVISPLLSGEDDLEPLGTIPTLDPDAQVDTSGGAGVTDEADPDADDLAMSQITGQPVPETFEVFSSRDPFQQLVVERPAGASEEPTAPEATPAATTTGGVTNIIIDASQPTVAAPADDSGDLSADPTEEPTEDPSAEPEGEGVSGQGTSPQGEGSAGTSAQGGYSPGEYWERPGAGTIEVSFLATTITTAGSDAVLMRISGTEYEVVEGEIFADRFWLLDIQEDCATLLFGDSRFTICVGETITK